MTNKSETPQQRAGRLGGIKGGKAKGRKGFAVLGSDAARAACASGKANARAAGKPIGFARMSTAEHAAVASKGGETYQSMLTPAERSLNCRRAARARWSKPTTTA